MADVFPVDDEELFVIDEVGDDDVIATDDTLKESDDSVATNVGNRPSGADDSGVIIEETNDPDFHIEVEPDEAGGAPQQNGTLSERVSLCCEIPSYASEFTGFLATKEYSMLTGEHIKNDANAARPKKVCFNCLGNHNINDCKVKKNFKEIARNRQAILGRKQGNTRYHDDVGNKYGNFKPGEISDNLRLALGLRDHEAPEFIYRMRVLGYPPGWLKEAEVRRSDVSLFDGSGKALSHPEDEEGQTDVSFVQYEPDKLISYPGFNVPFPSRMQDEHRFFRCPAMQPNHRKEEFEKFMKMNRVSKYKKKKLKLTDTPQSLEVRPSIAEMEIDNIGLVTSSPIEFNPPLPDEEQLPPLPSSPAPVKQKEDGELSSEDSSDSEIQRLDDTSEILSSKEALSDFTKETAVVTPANNSITATLVDNLPEDQTSSRECSSLLSTPVTTKPFSKKRHHRSQSKGFKLGVSIPESITPFAILPSPEKWTVDVTDHILFDNLPDALGTWNKMKGLVNKVRQSMEFIHADEDDDEA